MVRDPFTWIRRLSGDARATCLKGVVDQPLVVFLGEVPLDDLRRDHHREVDRLAADLLERAAGLELNLALRVLDDVVGLGARLLRASPRAAARRRTRLCVMIALGLDARLADDLRGLDVQPLQLLLRLLRVVERLADRVLTRLERAEQRPPGELRQQPSAARGTSTIVQMKSPGSGWTSGLSIGSRVPRSRAARSAARTLRPESRRLRAGRAAGSRRR